MVKIGINGFGRIGRSAFKAALDSHKNDVEIVALNDLTDSKTLAHLLKYDTAYGVYDQEVSASGNDIIVGGKTYPVFSEKEPANLPWRDLDVDVVIESTGFFTNKEGSMGHVKAGAKRVVISAPVKGGEVSTYLIGVNADKDKGSEQIINNASCTTNCIAPVAAVVHGNFGIEKALMTVVHSYTAEQRLQDAPHKDLRRARAAAENIVPTTTGAATATTEAIPELKGLFDGRAIRVPTLVGSISDFTFLLKKKVTVEEINAAFKEAVKNPLYKDILAVTEEPLVSSDIVGRTESAIVDLSLTQVVDGDLVKVFAWFDNELGYSHRLVELAVRAGKQIKK